jgi:4-alpha-glucanotransferase
VPAGAPTAQAGQWGPGPGIGFFNAVQKELGTFPFIDEDLGIVTKDMCALRDQMHIPGMRVIQFAFDRSPESPYLPEYYVSNAVVYTGTHYNNTARGWFEDLGNQQRLRMWKS